MIKKNKVLIIASFLVTLLPLFVGLLLWNQLPDVIATHFGLNNEPDGWTSKTGTVFGIPVFLCAMQAICIWATSADPRKKNISEKAFKIVIWIIPACSLIVCLASYGMALGKSINIGTVCCLFMGVLFIVLGNIMPKNQDNYTFGIRTPWALNDPDNWNYSNRLAGYCFVIGGVLILLTALTGKLVLVLPIVIIMALVPIVASYVYYLKHKGEAPEDKTDEEK